MNWIHHYQLFLFDFDGILVNTEELHYKAYLKMCADRGFVLNWDHKTFMNHAAYDSTDLKEGIYKALPELKRFEPSWDVLYREKQRAYISLLQEEGVSLMPGVDELLGILQEAKIKRCVVTNSAFEQTAWIRKQLPILDTIPHWITREQYSRPKPAAECYEKAIAQLQTPGDRVVGFEDSPRGLRALLATSAEAVLVSEFLDPASIDQLAHETGKQFRYCNSFPDFFKKQDNESS